MQLNPAKMARPVHADGRRYVPAIDGLRVLAAWGVISAHIGSEFQPSQQLVAFYGAAAYPALIVFFTISGFLVYRPFARAALAPRVKPTADRSTNFWIYILRRVLRIFPLYWAVLAVALVWNGSGNLESVTDWAQAIFLLPFPDPMKLLAGPLGIAMWTLAIELPFYVIVPLYAAGVKKARTRFAPTSDPFVPQVLAVSSLIAFILVLGLVFGGVLAFPVMSLPIGMLFAILETRQALARRRYRAIQLLADNWWACLAGYVCLVFVAARLALDAYDVPGVTDPYDHIRNLYFPLQLMMAMLLFIPVAFGVRRSLMVRFMAAAPLQIMAPLTYGIYLWHVPLIHHTTEWFGPGFLGFPVPGTTGFGMPTLFIALGLAIATFVLVELPAAKLRDTVDRWSRGGAAKAVPPDVGDGPARTSAHDAGPLARLEADPSGIEPDDDVDAVELVGHHPAVGDDIEDVEHIDVEDVEDDDRELVESYLPGEVGGRDGRPRPDPRPRPAGGGRRRTAVAVVEAPSTGAQLATPWCQPLDGFRAICACLAVAGHTFLAASILPFGGALHVLGILVALFFAISAFVLYQPFIEADVRRLPHPRAGTFYIKRLLRIYPLFALALTTYLVVLPEVRPEGWWGYVRLYLFLQIFGQELAAFKGMPSAWYLCNEVIFYLLMPVMAFGAARWSNGRRLRKPADRLRAHLAIGWGMVVLGPLTRTALYQFDVPQPTSLPLSHLEFFGFGVVIAAHAVGKRLGVPLPSALDWLRRHVALSYALVLIPVLALAEIANFWGDGSGLWQDGNWEDRMRFFAYFAAIVLLMSAATLGSVKEGANAFLSSKRFKPLSGLALHIYLWHQLVLSTMNRVVDGLDKVDLGTRFVTGLVLVLVAVAGTILLAWGTQALTDYPYQRYRAKVGRSRGRGAEPQPRGERGGHDRRLEPRPARA